MDTEIIWKKVDIPEARKVYPEIASVVAYEAAYQRRKRRKLMPDNNSGDNSTQEEVNMKNEDIFDYMEHEHYEHDHDNQHQEIDEIDREFYLDTGGES